MPLRSAPHCIEYAHLILWGQVRQGEEFDTDNDEHMKWVYERALERSQQFGIPVRLGGPQDRRRAGGQGGGVKEGAGPKVAGVGIWPKAGPMWCNLEALASGF